MVKQFTIYLVLAITLLTILPNTLYSDPPFFPTMTSGANAPMGLRYPSAAGFTRNDSAWVYLMGGLQDGNVISASCYRYNVKADTWETIPSLPNGPNWIGAACRLGNKIYYLGGTNNLALNFAQTGVQVYDVNTNTWSAAAPLIYGRTFLGAVAYQDSLIYVAGGWGYPGGAAYNDIYVYNSISNSWRAATSMNAPRSGGAFAIAGDTLVYVCGGPDWINPAMTNIVYRGVIKPDHTNIQWDTTGAVYPPGARSSIYGSNWGSKGIVVSGGYAFSGGTATIQCYVYSPGANVWTAQPTLLANKCDHAVATVNMGNSWKFVSVAGTSSRSGTNSNTVNILTDTMTYLVGVNEISNGVPQKFELMQNYPNPFNPETKIRFTIPKGNALPLTGGETEEVSLTIYDILGRTVESLVNQSLKAGEYEVVWNASRYNSGVYFAKLSYGGESRTIRLMLVK